MNYQGNNPEGYPDPTANQAVGIVSREEKEAAKAKKRAAREYGHQGSHESNQSNRRSIRTDDREQDHIQRQRNGGNIQMTNKERFIELLRSTKREGIEKLIDFLEKTDFFTAPASTRFHSSYEGGLLQHSLNVYDCLAGLGTTTGDVQEFQAAGMRLDSIPQESIIIVALLHDLCKVNFYATEMRWRKDANNKWEQYPVYAVNDRNPYGHGEKSVMMASEFIHLTMEERYAIRWHMGMSEANIIQTYCQAAEKYPLVLFTHMADQMATSYLETNTGNKKPEDIYLGTEPAAQDPEEFAEAEPI